MKVSSTLVFKAIVIVSFFYVFMEAKSIYLPILASVGLSFILYPIHGKLQQQMIVELADKRANRIAEQNAKDAGLNNN